MLTPRCCLATGKLRDNADRDIFGLLCARAGYLVGNKSASQSERITWLCEELGIEYELVKHQRDPFLSPQSIKDLNPIGQAPVIKDGRMTLPESGAIAEYIIHKYGNGKLALGPSDKDYAKYLYWFHFANGNLHPQLSRVMVLRHAHVNPEEWHTKRHFNQLTKFFELHGQPPQDESVAGDQFTATDIMNVFPLTTMRAFSGEDISAYPNILAWLKRATEREGYKKSRTKGDPELPLMIDGEPPAQFLDKLKAEGKM